jgi:hypothetical protein
MSILEVAEPWFSALHRIFIAGPSLLKDLGF